MPFGLRSSCRAVTFSFTAPSPTNKTHDSNYRHINMLVITGI